ncbi:CHAT domain-containing protein [Amycolatopsis sp. NPDC051071]|uniref:CHAT domain-containing protein n=1 Tax=Amycolatopsis sp. NPDC051071 TaxID=3154637 RepID=UPI0034238F46
MTSSTVPGTRELRLRAALLSHYELPWLGVGDDLTEAIGPGLFADSTRVRVGDGRRHWRLDDAVRRSLVQQATFGELRDTWARLRHRPDDDRQWAIDQYVGAAEPVKLDGLSLPRLRAVAWLARWLSGAAEHVPMGDVLTRRLGIGELLAPLRALAGDHFVGRGAVLAELDGRFSAQAGPVLIHGIGGIGKSAVAIRHLLDVADRRRAVVGYLNFDHSALDPAEPVSLIAALARQLTVQLPEGLDDGDGAARLASECHERLRAGNRALESPHHGIGGRGPHTDLLEKLASVLGDHRLLVVFDTLEEVQRLDRPIQRRFAEFLGELSAFPHRPSLVLAGRSPAPELGAAEISLTGLEPGEAITLLSNLLPEHPPEGLQQIIDLVGTSPLAVHLAAGVLRNAPRDEALRDIAVHRGTIEGELYRRLLGHIPDQDVRRLAHPGLTLRRVNPELIREVLAKPCGVRVPDLDRAHELFDGLAREAMLVTLTPDGRAVVHRTDVRQTMLHRLSADESVVVRQIHRAAVRFYTTRQGVTARAEEIYHRLMLGQRSATLDPRWDDLVLARLLPSMDDLPPASKAYLAAKTPSLSVSDDDLRQADIEVGRRLVVRRAVELISSGDGTEALWEIDDHLRRTGDRSPVLSGLRVQALELLGEFEPALAAAVEERKLLGQAGMTEELVVFTLHMARLYERLGRAAEAKNHLTATLVQCRRPPSTGPRSLSRLSIIVCMLRLRRFGMPLGEEMVDELSLEAVAVAERLQIKEINTVPGLLRDLAAEVGERSPRLLKAALRRIGLAGSESTQVAEALYGEAHQPMDPVPVGRLRLGSQVSELLEDEGDDVPEMTSRVLAEAFQSEADSALYRDYRPSDTAFPHSTLPLGDPDWHDLSRRTESSLAAEAGRDHHRAGRLAEAVAQYNRALRLIRQAELGMRPRLPVLLDRGLAYLALREDAAAEHDLTLCTRLASEHHLGRVGARAHQGLGALARRNGDVARALEHYETGIRMFQEVAPSQVAKVRIDQAKALLDAGLSNEADSVLFEALPELRAWSSGHEVAEAELVGAAARLLQDDPEQARRLAASAQRRFSRSKSTAWVEIARLMGMRADTAFVLSGGQAPRASANKARELADRLRGLGLEEESATAAMLGVRLAVHKGQLEVATRLLAGISAPNQDSSIDRRMLWRLCRAELAAASAEYGPAMREARKGLADLNKARTHRGGLDLVAGTAAHGRELGELAVRLSLRRRKARILFDILEQTKAQAYRYRPERAPDDPALRNRIAEMRELSRRQRQARLERRTTAALNVKLAALQQDITRLNWHSSPFGRQRPVADIASISARLGNRALVSFGRSGDVLFAVAVFDGRTRLIELGSAPALIEQVRRLHADTDAMAPDNLPEPLVRVVALSASRSAEQLDQGLIAPITRAIGSRELVLVPTGSLYAVPWGSLPSLTGVPVVVAPSATAWLAADEAAERPGGGRVVLVAGPGLSGATGEVQTLRALHPEATVLAGERATVANVLSALEGAELAHVAAHGSHEPGNALFSRLELADGPLFAHELTRLRRPPDQVVLAANALAHAHIRPGDEALGFAGALLAVGTRTVVAAVSRIGDESTAATSADLHQGLANGRSMAQALADSVRTEPFRRPFICLGSA